MEEIIRIDGYGPSPTESHQCEHHDSDRIKMLYRVERHSSVEFCRRIAAFIGNERMRKLVQRNDDHDRKKTCEEIYYIVHFYYTVFYPKKQVCERIFQNIMLEKRLFIRFRKKISGNDVVSCQILIGLRLDDVFPFSVFHQHTGRNQVAVIVHRHGIIIGSRGKNS